MLFPVQDCLIKMRNAPPLRDIKLELLCQFISCRTCRDIPPGTECCQLVSFFIKWQISMHHGGDANRTRCGDFLTKLLPKIFFQFPVAGLKSGYDLFCRISPITIFKLVFPLITAGCYRKVIPVKHHCFDAGGTKFYTDHGLFQIHFLLLYSFSRRLTAS